MHRLDAKESAQYNWHLLIRSRKLWLVLSSCPKIALTQIGHFPSAYRWEPAGPEPAQRPGRRVFGLPRTSFEAAATWVMRRIVRGSQPRATPTRFGSRLAKNAMAFCACGMPANSRSCLRRVESYSSNDHRTPGCSDMRISASNGWRSAMYRPSCKDASSHEALPWRALDSVSAAESGNCYDL